MPTGYTAGVEDGTITTFAEFAILCARAFGATITMRDEPMDATIPEEFKPDAHHARRGAEATARLAELEAMDESTAAAEARRQHEESVRRAVEALERIREKNGRYEAMLSEVEEWQPPTADHVRMKEFMLEQLRASMYSHADWYWRDVNAPCPTGAEWLQEQKAEAARSIEYHSEHYAEEVERCRQRTEWVRALRDSLAATVP